MINLTASANYKVTEHEPGLDLGQVVLFSNLIIFNNR